MEQAVETKPDEQFNLVISQFNAPDEMRNNVLTLMQEYFAKINEWDGMIKTIFNTDEIDNSKSQLARVGRLDLKNRRIEKEKKIKAEREKLKVKMADDILLDKLLLRADQIIGAGFEHLEAKLLGIENYQENKIKEEKKQRAAQRKLLLEPYQDYINVMAYDLENMPDEQFEITLQGVQHSYNLKQEQIKAEKEKTERAAKRKDELIVAGLKFDGTYFYAHQTQTNVKLVNEMSDEDYQLFYNESLEIIAAEKQRQAERDAELQRLKDEQELRNKRLARLSPAMYYGIPPNGNVKWNDNEVLTDDQLITISDVEFNSFVDSFLVMVNTHKRLEALNEERKSIIAPYKDYITVIDDFRKFTDKEFKELLHGAKKAHDDKQKLISRNDDRKKILFDLGFTHNGTMYKLDWCGEIADQEVMYWDDVQFQTFINTAKESIEFLETKRKEQEKLETGSDKEKLIAFSKTELPYPVLKSKKAKAILDKFNIGISKAFGELTNDIEKL